jgi:hypothetical protein
MSERISFKRKELLALQDFIEQSDKLGTSIGYNRNSLYNAKRKIRMASS